jgi:hypothetical protein
LEKLPDCNLALTFSPFPQFGPNYVVISEAPNNAFWSKTETFTKVQQNPMCVIKMFYGSLIDKIPRSDQSLEPTETPLI